MVYATERVPVSQLDIRDKRKNEEMRYNIKYHMRSIYLRQGLVKRQKKRQAGKKQRKETERQTEAHLTVAIRREGYSIALTKCFENTVKLQEGRNKGRE